MWIMKKTKHELPRATALTGTFVTVGTVVFGVDATHTGFFQEALNHDLALVRGAEVPLLEVKGCHGGAARRCPGALH